MRKKVLFFLQLLRWFRFQKSILRIHFLSVFRLWFCCWKIREFRFWTMHWICIRSNPDGPKIWDFTVFGSEMSKSCQNILLSKIPSTKLWSTRPALVSLVKMSLELYPKTPYCGAPNSCGCLYSLPWCSSLHNSAFHNSVFQGYISEIIIAKAQIDFQRILQFKCRKTIPKIFSNPIHVS